MILNTWIHTGEVGGSSLVKVIVMRTSLPSLVRLQNTTVSYKYKMMQAKFIYKVFIS